MVKAASHELILSQLYFQYNAANLKFLVPLGASNPTVLLASNESENFFRNEVSIEIDSQSNCRQILLSVAEELDKAIKKGYTPTFMWDSIKLKI